MQQKSRPSARIAYYALWRQSGDGAARLVGLTPLYLHVTRYCQSADGAVLTIHQAPESDSERAGLHWKVAVGPAADRPWPQARKQFQSSNSRRASPCTIASDVAARAASMRAKIFLPRPALLVSQGLKERCGCGNHGVGQPVGKMIRLVPVNHKTLASGCAIR